MEADAEPALAGGALAASAARLSIDAVGAAQVVLAVVTAAIVAVSRAVTEAARAVARGDCLLAARLARHRRAVASVDVGVGGLVEVEGEVLAVARLALTSFTTLMASGRASDVVALFVATLKSSLAVARRARAAAAALGLWRLAKASGAARGRRVRKAVACAAIAAALVVGIAQLTVGGLAG